MSLEAVSQLKSLKKCQQLLDFNAKRAKLNICTQNNLVSQSRSLIESGFGSMMVLQESLDAEGDEDSVGKDSKYSKAYLSYLSRVR